MGLNIGKAGQRPDLYHDDKKRSTKMKIFYAVQATGNGHISRAMDLLPHLRKHGTVDIFLSGKNSSLELDAVVKYRSNGLSLYYNCSGGLDYWKTMRSINPIRLKQETTDLPVEKYDLVINDFEYITSAACAKKKIPSINFGHQASFQSANVPRPNAKDKVGEWVLRNYAKASHYIGLHFEKYDEFIFHPVVKKEILNAEPKDKYHITVYLPSFCEPQLEKIFHNFRDFHFEIFSKQRKIPKPSRNITFLPVDKNLFNRSLIHCSGIVTGGGFETPAEAIHLGKKIMCIPIRGQYEQICNVAALERLGITCLKNVDESFPLEFYNWLFCKKPIRIDYSKTIPETLEFLFSTREKIKNHRAVEIEKANQNSDFLVE